MKLKEKTMKLDKICEKLTTCLESHLEEGVQDADAKEIESVANSIHYLSEAKENAAKSMYYEQIMTAMQDHEYGEDYDEDGMLKGYRGRSATTGRYVHRAYEEKMMRDMDRHDGRMYYSVDSSPEQRISGSNSRGYEEGYNKGYEDGRSASRNHGGSGRMDSARRGYEESKMHNNGDADKTKQREKLQHLMDTLEEELTPYGPTMDSTEKQIVRNGLQKMINKFA